MLPKERIGKLSRDLMNQCGYVLSSYDEDLLKLYFDAIYRECAGIAATKGDDGSLSGGKNAQYIAQLIKEAGGIE